MDDKTDKMLNALFSELTEDEQERQRTNEECGFVYVEDNEDEDEDENENENEDEDINFSNYLDATFQTFDLVRIIDTYRADLRQLKTYFLARRYYLEHHRYMIEQLDKIRHIIADILETAEKFVIYDPEEQY